MENLTELSVKYMTETDLAHRKAYGQYMTPPEVSSILFNQLTFTDGQTILDPAVGTGELLLAAQKLNPTLNLWGFDIDPNILKVANQNIPAATLTQQSIYDPLPTQYHNFFDFIIGNPPYFEINTKQQNLDEFHTAGGRPNIYALFFEKYTPLLKVGGKLAYIVPPSMNAGAFFTNLRKYILKHYHIDFLQVVRQEDHFQDAQQSVQIIILTKLATTPLSSVAAGNKYVADFNLIAKDKNLPTIFTDKKQDIIAAWKGKQNLNQLGYKVSTGTIMWNEQKAFLTDTQIADNHILYYAKDITSNNTVSLNSALDSRRWLSCSKPTTTVDSIIVNRIIGSLRNPQLKCAIVKATVPYYTENHLNVITATPKATISLQEVYTRLTSFPNLKNYLQAITGNTQLSGKELMFLMPL